MLQSVERIPCQYASSAGDLFQGAGLGVPVKSSIFIDHVVVLL